MCGHRFSTVSKSKVSDHLPLDLGMGSPPDPPSQQLWWIHASPHGGAGVLSPHGCTVWQRGCRQGQCTACQLAHPGHTSPGPPAAPLGRYCSSTTLLQIQRGTCCPVPSFLTGLEQQDQGHAFRPAWGGKQNTFMCRNGRGGRGLLACTVDRGLPSFQLFARFVKVRRHSFLEKAQRQLVLCPSWVHCPLHTHEKPW